MSTITPILEITSLTKHFGGVTAVSNIDISVQQGQIASLIGPNGAGKTTLFNCVTGLEPPTEGSVKFQNRNIVGLRPDQIAGNWNGADISKHPPVFSTDGLG